ncbi:hypothetical protein [Methanosphaerula palustris]|uniref:Uncharacterized protein n=1 Tax=Methanosphaerula palustris (strain ATCC BAA-1556 / DSM 19958 / E1-9c) TaxID=521011 RepID=B8GIZ5_METPE|nr:hypothetical protein [Methanosphaerula palustris]ACL15568.1 hypothetical protein Mpal_0178 [Methanosphaerula palustris E1-9c]
MISSRGENSYRYIEMVALVLGLPLPLVISASAVATTEVHLVSPPLRG